MSERLHLITPPPLDAATLHIVAGLDHHEEARATHADVRVGLELIATWASNTLRSRSSIAWSASDSLAMRTMSAMQRCLADIAAEARLACEKHADTERSHRAIRRAMEFAQSSIACAAPRPPAKDTGEAATPPSRGRARATPRKWWRWRKDDVRKAPAGGDATDRTREECPRVD